jgi:hypothetical protein
MDCTADPAMMLKRRRFAEFFVSNFTPWSATRPPVLCYETWIDHVRVLEYEACLRRRREPDIPVGATYDERSAIEVARLSRLIAAGRLFDLDNIIGCFKTKRAAVVLLCKHRSRARTLWSQSGENKPNGFTAPADERRAAAAAIQKLLDKTARLRCPRDQASRQNDAAWASQFAKSLCGALPSSRGKKENGDASLRRLQSIWKQAAFPVRRSLQGGVHDPRKLSAALKQSLVMAESDASGIISSSVDTYITRHAMIANTICADPFADIDDPAYERAVEAHNSAGLPAKDAPLNPEQRAAGRNFVKFAQLMKQSREQGWTQQDITNNASRLGLKQITMMTGAGGTGKSKVVHAIQREFQRLGLGRLLVTAYTGVAAAPFGGPTLLTLLNLNVHTKSKRHLQGGDAEYRARIRKKFEDECGAPIEEFGGVVIDEISFIDATVFGHVDNGFNILLGKKSFGETLCGGMPLLLSGDNHQKPPPGGTPWHQHLVKVATKEFDNPGRHASDNALKRGLNLLRKAQRIDFKRQMRARNDPAFIDFQMKMRRTDVVHPIPDMFLQQMRTVSKHDLEEDAAWLFAPIGVLSHVERDAINLGQLKAFAAKFNLPIVRWRNELVDGSAFETHSIRDELFNHERNLWSYFVEGAPVLLGKTIKSVRKLVNGSPGLLDSLNVINAADLQRIENGYNTGFDKNMVTLESMPLAVNVVVGGTEDAPILWHEVPLPDLSRLIPEFTIPRSTEDFDGCEDERNNCAQVIPLLLSPSSETADCYSVYAAQQGICNKILVRRHPYELAFALTDYKLQGRTLPKLIISLCTRVRMPWMTLSSFYVLISRVESLKGLRILQFDRDGLDAVRRQMPDLYLHAWEQAYTDTGDWSDDRAIAALNNIRDLRNREKQAAAQEMRTQSLTISPNHRATKRRLPQMTPDNSKPRAKKVYTCSICKSPDHRRDKCTSVTRTAKNALLE